MIIIHGIDLSYAAGGVIAGWLLRRPRRASVPPPAAPVGPVCQCGHLYAFHAADSGVCQHVASRHEKQKTAIRNDDGRVVKDSYGYVQYQVEIVPLPDVRCPCQRYTGPDPLPTVVDLS